jgi:uncharacterized protein (UPF0332 family)
MRIKMEEHDQNNEFGRKVFEQFMDLFVTPEVKRRQETGELGKPLDLRAAQIIFFSDGRKPQVRINSEVKAIGKKMKLKPGIFKKAGDPIFEHELEGLKEINLTEEDDPDCGHATLLRIGGRWIIAFDFRYNKSLSKRHIKTAEQFYEATEFSLNQRNWSAFIDNLFSAAELLAKSILLSMPNPKFRKKATHKAIQARYNRFADLGNVEAVYRETFNKLSGLRDRARYLKGDISISEEGARRLLVIIKNMMEDAARRVGIHYT